MRLALLILLFTLTAPGGAGPGSADEALERLGECVQSLRRDASAWDEATSDPRRPPPADELREIAPSLRARARVSEAGRQEVASGFLDLSAAAWAAVQRPDPEDAAGGAEAYATAVEELDTIGTDELTAWLASTVVVSALEHSPERRAAAARQLADDPSSRTMLALVTATHDPDARVRDAALGALVGRDQPIVHALFARTLDGGPADPAAGHAERHFRSVRLAPDDRATPLVERAVTGRLAAEDWREAARAIALAHALPDETAVPRLIGALAIWIQRAATGEGPARLMADVERELTTRAGRSLGLDAGRWRLWWESAPGERSETGGGGETRPATRASFFGLRATTDCVVFVIDRSGSMDRDFGWAAGRSATEPRSRYEEAIEQMAAFLEALGERTRFDIVLFSDRTDVWRSQLARADAGNIAAARRWLARKRPGGGTYLRQGVERALGLDRDGRFDPGKLEADTLVVLCDGATGDGGPYWAVPLMRRVGPLARTVIHGVQIGAGGDGTLEALARESGGDFLAVEP